MISLNKHQAEAVNLNHPRILCLAGAGTGKTFCMIERISRLTGEGVDPSSILALTFTNAAAFEMKERYLKRNPQAPKIPEFRTFHSFCYSLLTQDAHVRSKLGYSSVPMIADEGQDKQIKTRANMQMGIKSDAKTSDPRRYKDLSLKEKQNLKMLRASERRISVNQGLITFDALLEGVCDLFAEKADCIQKYINQYKYIFVDEFQDTDPRQWAFVSTFKDSNIFIVGDALQAIYGFRNADSSIIKSLSKDTNWAVVRLDRNYRSTKSIVQFANESSEYAEEDYRVKLVSDVPGDDVAILSMKDISPSKDINEIVQYFLDVHKLQEGTAAILAATNAEVSEISYALGSKGAEFTTKGVKSDALHVLNSALSNEYLLNWCTSELNTNMYSKYVRSSTILRELGDEYTIKDFVKEFGFHPSISYKLNTTSKVRKILNDVSRPTYERLYETNKLLGTSIEMPNSDDLTPKKFVEVMIEALEESKSSDLYVGTIHSVKGLEYDTVFVYGLGTRAFNLVTEEKKNLFYVAVTRAKSHLYILQEA